MIKTGKQVDHCMQSIQLVAMETKHHGFGVFTKKYIPKGEGILKFTGKLMPIDNANELVRRGEIRNDDPLQVASDAVLILNALPYGFNHSCGPNAGLRNECELFALRDIAAGEEIRYDYSTTVSYTNPISDWTMRCSCGSAECRQIIGHVLTIPPERIAAYMEAGAFQAYMLRELHQIGKLLIKARA